MGHGIPYGFWDHNIWKEGCTWNCHVLPTQKDLWPIEITWKMSGMFVWSIGGNKSTAELTCTNFEAKICKSQWASHLAIGVRDPYLFLYYIFLIFFIENYFFQNLWWKYWCEHKGRIYKNLLIFIYCNKHHRRSNKVCIGFCGFLVPLAFSTSYTLISSSFHFLKIRNHVGWSQHPHMNSQHNKNMTTFQISITFAHSNYLQITEIDCLQVYIHVSLMLAYIFACRWMR